MLAVGSLSSRRLSAVGLGQQGVETIVCASIISSVVHMAVVDAGTG